VPPWRARAEIKTALARAILRRGPGRPRQPAERIQKSGMEENNSYESRDPTEVRSRRAGRIVNRYQARWACAVMRSLRSRQAEKSLPHWLSGPIWHCKSENSYPSIANVKRRGHCSVGPFGAGYGTVNARRRVEFARVVRTSELTEAACRRRCGFDRRRRPFFGQSKHAGGS